jgi:soluble lytic murein transglycosylase
MACGELGTSDMQGRDLIERASNLMKFMDYKGAESVLRSALEKDDGSLTNEIMKNLGLSLFRQKRYSEAAEIYEKAGETFWKVYSLYRAGGKEAFNSSLEDLQKSGDARAGLIFLAFASDKRRDGEIKEALKIYQNVLEQYPAESENALWGIGWTYFMSGAYEEAADIFAKLYEKNGDTRYLYWKARSLEASGKDIKDLYLTLRKRKGDFYSAMSFQRMKEPVEQLDTKETIKSLGDIGNKENNSLSPQFNSTIGKVGYRKNNKFERAEVLSELGFSRDALSELISISKTITSIEDILYVGSKLQDLGEYKYLVNLADRLPAIETVHHLRYPHAYWNIVEPASRIYSIDPFFVLSIMREESTFDPNARSTAGAVGLMQIMPQTAFRLNKYLHLGITNASHVWNIKNNIQIGTFYLSTLIREFGSCVHALAAYNAGEEKVKKWIQKGNYKSIDEFIEDIPYNETRNYVKRVLTTFFEYKRSLGNNETIKKSEEMGRL